jgi:hypothetical protein
MMDKLHKPSDSELKTCSCEFIRMVVSKKGKKVGERPFETKDKLGILLQ